MNKNTLTIAAIVVLAAVFATGSVVSSEIAFANGHHSSKPIKQTLAQNNYCGNGFMPLDIRCQNLSNQIKGSHNAVNIIGIQPSNSGGMNHGDDHKNDGGSSDDHDGNGGQQSGSGGQQSGSGGQPIASGKPQTSALSQNSVPSGNPAIGAGA
ncbi:MAG TPA: hypothetical protein VH500_16395 [Nitrososphaeraceae archaeon]